MHKDNLKISVITPVMDDRSNFDGYFDALFNQTVPLDTFEVILITSNQSQFDSVMESYSKIGLNNDCKIDLQVFLVENIGRSRAKAMNYGIKKSRAYLFYFLGDDFIPNHDAIAEHLKFHDANIKITDVGIGMAFVPDNFKTDFVEWLENSGSLFGVPFKRSITELPSDFFYLANTSIKREFIFQGGLFDEDYLHQCWDDWELGNRLKQLGMYTRLVSGAEAIHQHEVTFEERLIAVQESGIACKLYEEKNPNCDKPWRKTVNRNLQVLSFKIFLYKFLFKLIGFERLNHRYFKYHIDFAFIQGYHRANLDRNNSASY